MFFDKISELCRKKNIHVSNLCDDLHISRGNIARWKKGTVPSADKLSRIANYFNVSTDYLLNNERISPKFPDVTFNDFTYAMYNESTELTEENKQKLLEMARFFKEQQDKEKNQK